MSDYSAKRLSLGYDSLYSSWHVWNDVGVADIKRGKMLIGYSMEHMPTLTEVELLAYNGDP